MVIHSKSVVYFVKQETYLRVQRQGRGLSQGEPLQQRRPSWIFSSCSKKKKKSYEHVCQRIPFRTRRKRIWHSSCAVHTYTTKDTHKILPVSTGSAVRKDAHTKQNIANNCDEFPFCVLPLVYTVKYIVLHSIVNTYSSLVQ